MSTALAHWTGALLPVTRRFVGRLARNSPAKRIAQMAAIPSASFTNGQSMRAVSAILLIALYTAYTGQSPTKAAERSNGGITCAPAGKAYLRTTLYFGTKHSAGNVTDEQWRAFLHDEVTPRFPEGLTVWEAAGQWRTRDGNIDGERAKVLSIVHDEALDVRASLTAIVASYKRMFRQESVLSETARVCAAF
jgi:hypothetical protein